MLELATGGSTLTVAKLRAVVLPFALILMFAGFVGFMAPVAIITETISVPSTFEWPVGVASGVITTEDGLHVVPLTPVGRVQVYDANWRFVRGWQVDGSGGTFAVTNTNDGAIAVLITRGDTREVYETTGQFISSESFDGEVSRAQEASFESKSLMTKPHLFPLWGPGIAWLLGAAGMALAVAVTLGLSLAPQEVLNKLRLSSGQEEGVSQPSYGLIASYGMGVLIAVFMAFSIPNTIIKVFIAGSVLANMVQVRRQVWGFEIQGEVVRIWFPLSPSLEVVLQRSQLTSIEPPSGFGSQMKIPLENGKSVALSAIGTTRFRLLTDHILHLRFTA